MNDKQQLAAMGAQYRLTEEQAKGLAERMPKTGILQILDDEPLCTEIRINGVEACGADIGGLLDRCLPHTTEQKPLCMAKRIEELEAQVRAMAELLRDARKYVTALGKPDDEVSAGQVPEQHPDDAAVDRFTTAMKSKLAAAREKGRGGWDDPNACSVEFLADLMVGHIGKGNPGNFEDISNLAMMLHQRGADPAVLAGKVPTPVVPEGWQLVPVEPTERMISESIDAGRFDEDDAVFFWASMLAAAPSPDGAK